MSNRQQLEDAKILQQHDQLSEVQEKAIESLSVTELEVLMSVRTRANDKLPEEVLSFPITHHH